MSISVNDRISLEFLEGEHASSLLNLVNTNREYLREWLPWVDNMQTVENFKAYIADTKRRAIEGTDFGYAIMLNKNIVGRIGLHHINHQNKIAEIGYWLDAGSQGQGIISKSCAALIDHSFHNLGLNRVEIKCATGNNKSRAIPEKLNFKLEGTIRQGELLYGKFIDLYLYAGLKEEWKKKV